MTIMKAIAMTALAGTLLAGPSAAIAQSTEHGNSATAHQNNADRKAAQDTAKDQRATDHGGTQNHQGDGGGTAEAGSAKANGKALGQPNFGTVVSSLHRNGGTVSTTDLTGLSGSITVQEVDLTAYAKGNNMRAIDNALRNVDQATLQSTLSANADVVAALNAQGITDLSTVAYAYVDTSGELVVFTR